MSYISDFEELNGGYVAFGGNPNGGKNSKKGKIRTGLDEFAIKHVVENCDAKTSETKLKDVRKNNDALMIEEWVLDDEEKEVNQPKIDQKIVKPSIPKIDFVKPKQPEKKARKTVKHVEKARQNTHRPRGNQGNWNNMMSQKLGSNFEIMKKLMKDMLPLEVTPKERKSQEKIYLHRNDFFLKQRISSLIVKSMSSSIPPTAGITIFITSELTSLESGGDAST
nr:hypothetical protein [Tanacetum cinerariifolium]